MTFVPCPAAEGDVLLWRQAAARVETFSEEAGHHSLEVAVFALGHKSRVSDHGMIRVALNNGITPVRWWWNDIAAAALGGSRLVRGLARREGVGTSRLRKYGRPRALR